MGLGLMEESKRLISRELAYLMHASACTESLVKCCRQDITSVFRVELGKG